MPIKLNKKVDENKLVVERIQYARNYSMTVDKNKCVGCEICKTVCPKEAIEIRPVTKVAGEKAKRPIIDVSEQKCHYCGICEAICPYGAISVLTNGEHVVPVVKTESFPQLSREINVDTSKCDVDCVDCEEACPLNLIKVNVLPAGEGGKPQVNIDIKKEQCPGCRLCEMKCPEGAISVMRTFYGTMKINAAKCPEGCTDCLDVCPITGALYLSEQDKKVHANETYCVYCGTCRTVCPAKEALDLQRISIRHTAVRSGAWNKALEKLASTKEMTKELRVKGLARARNAVDKRMSWKAS